MNRLREESEASKFEMTNRILQMEISLAEAEEEKRRLIRVAAAAKEKLEEAERRQNELADAFSQLKANKVSFAVAQQKGVSILIILLSHVHIWSYCYSSLSLSLYLRHYKSPTAPLDMHHLTCGINSLLRSVNLIVFTLLLVHVILRISPHHSHHLRSRHLSLPRPFTPDLKLISFTNPFLHSHSYSFRTGFTDLNLYCIKGSLALFVFVSFSGYVC